MRLYKNNNEIIRNLHYQKHKFENGIDEITTKRT